MDINEVNTPKKLMKFLQTNLKYGFTYKGKVYVPNYPDFQKDMDRLYKIRLGDDFIKNGYGVCWDFCEFERLVFEKLGIKHECFFILSFITRAQGGPTHSFALFYKGKKCYWFEYSWADFEGIWEYNSKEEALKDIVEKYKKYNNVKNLEMYKIGKVSKRLNTYEYVEHCLNQENINLKKL